MLILAKYYKRIMTFLSKFLLDERESFSNSSKTNEFKMEETSYTPPSPNKKESKLKIDTKMISHLQKQMNELFRLSEKATEINKSLMKYN